MPKNCILYSVRRNTDKYREIAMRSVEEQMIEINRRRKCYEYRRKNIVTAIVGAVLFAALVSVMVIAPNLSESVGQNTVTVLGSTIFDEKVGGYVLVALIAFSLGICVSLWCFRAKEQQNMKNRKD